MSIQTRVIWSPETDTTGVAQKAQEMFSQQTDPVQVTVDPNTGYQTVDRFWADVDSANAWIAIVNPYGPVSATIIT